MLTTNKKYAALSMRLALTPLLGLSCLMLPVAAAPNPTIDPLLKTMLPLEVQLDSEDLAILKELTRKESKKTGLTSKPVVSSPGEVSFIFGASNPTLVCSLLRVCDIALEPGENVVDIKVGDSTRWIIERSASGSPQGIVEHVTVKPTDVGLISNLRIYTDRRSYYLDLKSSDKEFMPLVRFLYPENTLQKFAQVKEQLQQQGAERARQTLSLIHI